jgi:hypothetical protein
MWLPVRQQTGLFKTFDGRTVTIGVRGTPDYLVVHGTYPAFFLETKRPRKGVVSEAQKLKGLELAQGYRIPVVVVNSADALVKFLTDHEARHRA